MICQIVYQLLLFIIIAHTVIDARAIQEDTVGQLVDGITNENEEMFATVINYRHRFEHSNNIKALRWMFQQHIDAEEVYCEICHILLPILRILIDANQTERIENVTLEICNKFGLVLDVCSGAVHEYKDAVLQVIYLTHFSDKALCSLALNCDRQTDYPALNWTVAIPDKKPPPQPPKPPSPDSPKLKVLQLADIHVDFEYKPGSEADCLEPLCCRKGPPLPGHPGAGFWGTSLHCDLPYWTAQAILEYASKTEEIDFIYYTGDTPPHNVWNQSRADQLYSITTINNLLATTFPNKMLYSAVGNHEAAPCNLFPTPIIKSDNISWLYQALADSWINTLGLPNDTRESILRGGFYTTLVRPGLRLISLNTNYYASDNYWLFVNSTDPLNQLEWFIQWLQYAEDNGEKVHIIAHHPPRTCFAAFGWNFNRIVNRFENTISGQFYGHTHRDEFNMFYDENDRQRPVSMAYIAPSLTTESFLNPGYRIYTIDGDYPSSSYWVLDHRTVIMNLTATNLYNRTILQDEYNVRTAYQLENLFPVDWDNFIKRLEYDIDGPLMSTVYTYYTKSHADGSQCNHVCRRALICDFKTARDDDPYACDSVPPFA
ncbi:unnamed protein product [Rotaria magnacalcarata]|uniref:Sphingomyelin phosphodiesterase n=1 Tax=Rotaria magnacalcarata TaxID=392030 RepID=A0A816GYV4_9BILA|nr:unnamed protein product [Rotaria magnacalcarata]CAF3947998.1 unnamed protein product [Rotaria magnacalcarata]